MPDVQGVKAPSLPAPDLPDSGDWALREIHDAGRLYERYLELSRIAQYPLPEQDQSLQADPLPTSDRPLGLVLDTSRPLGLHLTVSE